MSNLLGLNRSRVLILGPNGSGKTALASRILDHFNYRHLSVENLVQNYLYSLYARGALSNLTDELGPGDAQADDIVMDAVNRAVRFASQADWILEDYPKTIKQAEELDKIVKIDAVFFIRLPKEESLTRETYDEYNFADDSFQDDRIGFLPEQSGKSDNTKVSNMINFKDNLMSKSDENSKKNINNATPVKLLPQTYRDKYDKINVREMIQNILFSAEQKSNNDKSKKAITSKSRMLSPNFTKNIPGGINNMIYVQKRRLSPKPKFSEIVPNGEAGVQKSRRSPNPTKFKNNLNALSQRSEQFGELIANELESKMKEKFDEPRNEPQLMVREELDEPGNEREFMIEEVQPENKNHKNSMINEEHTETEKQNSMIKEELTKPKGQQELLVKENLSTSKKMTTKKQNEKESTKNYFENQNQPHIMKEGQSKSNKITPTETKIKNVNEEKILFGKRTYYEESDSEDDSDEYENYSDHSEFDPCAFVTEYDITFCRKGEPFQTYPDKENSVHSRRSKNTLDSKSDGFQLKDKKSWEEDKSESDLKKINLKDDQLYKYTSSSNILKSFTSKYSIINDHKKNVKNMESLNVTNNVRKLKNGSIFKDDNGTKTSVSKKAIGPSQASSSQKSIQDGYKHLEKILKLPKKNCDCEGIVSSKKVDFVCVCEDEQVDQKHNNDQKSAIQIDHKNEDLQDDRKHNDGQKKRDPADDKYSSDMTQEDQADKQKNHNQKSKDEPDKENDNDRKIINQLIQNADDDHNQADTLKTNEIQIVRKKEVNAIEGIANHFNKNVVVNDKAEEDCKEEVNAIDRVVSKCEGVKPIAKKVNVIGKVINDRNKNEVKGLNTVIGDCKKEANANDRVVKDRKSQDQPKGGELIDRDQLKKDELVVPMSDKPVDGRHQLKKDELVVPMSDKPVDDRDQLKKDELVVPMSHKPVDDRDQLKKDESVVPMSYKPVDDRDQLKKDELVVPMSYKPVDDRDQLKKDELVVPMSDKPVDDRDQLKKDELVVPMSDKPVDDRDQLKKDELVVPMSYKPVDDRDQLKKDELVVPMSDKPVDGVAIHYKKKGVLRILQADNFENLWSEAYHILTEIEGPKIKHYNRTEY